MPMVSTPDLQLKCRNLQIFSKTSDEILLVLKAHANKAE